MSKHNNKKSYNEVMLEEPYTGASYHNISSLFFLQNSDQSKNLSIRWERWLNRFRFYRNVDEAREYADPKYETFLDWQDNRKKIWRQEKLYEKLLALDEFDKIRHQLDGKVAVDLNEALVRLINIELTKLEIDQLKKLEKAEQIKRTAEIEEHRQALLIDKQYIYKNLIKREVSFLEYLNANNPNSKNLYKMIDARKSKIRYSYLLQRTEDASSGFSFINSGLDLFVRIAAAGYIGIIKFSQAFINTLSSIPLISIALTGIHLTLNLVKSIAQKKSDKKVVVGIAVLGIVGAALLGTAFAPIAGAFIASTLVSLVYTTQHFIPWIAMRRKISKDSKDLDNAIDRFNLVAKKDHELVLTNSEKKLVVRELERYCVKLTENGNINQLQSTIKLINDAKDHKDVKRLEKNPLIKSMLAANVKPDLKGIVLRESRIQLRQVRVDLKALKTYEKEHRWKVATGLLGVVGAILLCIPTPVTWVVGASLLTASTVVGLGLKYRVVPRIMNFFREKFADKKVEPAVVKAEVEPSLTNTFVRKSLMQAPAKIVKSTLIPAVKLARPAKVTASSAALFSTSYEKTAKDKKVIVEDSKPIVQP
ncbi:MAG: hypothetical protein WAW86_08160 [Gammaproteobacteria bacterium]